jgi:phosphoketolase
MNAAITSTTHHPQRQTLLLSNLSPVEFFRLHGNLSPEIQEWLVDDHERLSQIENLTRDLVAGLAWAKAELQEKEQKVLEHLQGLLS